MVTAVKPRKSKPLPLVDLFRKPKHDQLDHVPSLGSGVQNLPHSSLDIAYEPYTPNTTTLLNSLARSKSRPRKGQESNECAISPTIPKQEPMAAYTTASPSRSRSLSRDTDTLRTRSSSRSRSYSVGEQSVVDINHLPPVPSIPAKHQLAHKLSKASINSSKLSSPRSPNNATSDSERRRKPGHEQDRNEMRTSHDQDYPGIKHSEQPLDRAKSMVAPRGHAPPKEAPTSKSNPTSPRERNARGHKPTMSSSSSSDEDDNIPLAATTMAPAWLQNKPLGKRIQLKVNLDRSMTHSSLLDDDEEDDDEDLIPIAALSPMSPVRGDFMTAADKYKEKVRDRIFRDKVSSSSSDEQEEDNIPIQQTRMMRQNRRLSDDNGRIDHVPEDDARGRSRSRTRINASEKPARSRAERDNIPPVPRLPTIYNI